MNTLKGTSLLVMVSLALTGCVGTGAKKDFACPGGQGVNCMSALDVYAATENRDHLEGLTNADGQLTAGAPPSARQRARTEVIESDGALMLTGSAEMLTPDAPEDVPIRTPARVMRIWIAPWEDEAGDLNVPGKVFTEIEPRRWAVGEPQPRGTLATLQLVAPPKATTVAAQNTASGDADTAGMRSAEQ